MAVPREHAGKCRADTRGGSSDYGDRPQSAHGFFTIFMQSAAQNWAADCNSVR
jgi:hypothetical protein